MKAVLDTNVLVSGIAFGGTPRTLLEVAQKQEFMMVVSHDIPAEYGEVIERIARRYSVARATAQTRNLASTLGSAYRRPQRQTGDW